ncbi:hypothetical protein [Baekduia sp. Peel2402]|uniref:hypothetical protein n=1 Tax=Baekduia sp. Peel2402 TaxID=3458296 RepID=UPI00403E9F8A
MVNNTDIHTAPARRLAPGWDYWALTLLGAPLAASAFGLIFFTVLDGEAADWTVAVLAVLLSGAIGWHAPSARRLTSGLRAFWACVTAGLSVAIPVAIAFGLLYAACHDGGCFS